MTPRLEAPWFGADDSVYARMARVLEYTARQHCPDWRVNVERVTVETMRKHRQAVESHRFNTQKMVTWARVVGEARDGECIALLDADTFIARPLDPIWDQDFDLAYTAKQSRFPFNSGVVFVRVNDKTRRFFSEWEAVNRKMLVSGEHHMRWRAKYGGINQAALGQMLETGLAQRMDILPVPCVEWNCEDSAWVNFDPDMTRIVHVKSKLRMAVFETKGRVFGPHIAGLAEMWHELEGEAEGGRIKAVHVDWNGASR